jgi:hypothetical protein
VAKDEALRKAKVLLELHQGPHPIEVAEDKGSYPQGKGPGPSRATRDTSQRGGQGRSSPQGQGSPRATPEATSFLKAMALALLSLLPQLLLLLLLQVHQGVIILFSCSCDGNEIQGLAERMQE